jgi:hypothetical protein
VNFFLIKNGTKFIRLSDLLKFQISFGGDHVRNIHTLQQIYHILYTVIPVYKGDQWEHENVAFVSSYPYIHVKIICSIHEMENMKVPIIDSDLLYTGVV